MNKSPECLSTLRRINNKTLRKGILACRSNSVLLAEIRMPANEIPEKRVGKWMRPRVLSLYTRVDFVVQQPTERPS